MNLEENSHSPKLLEFRTRGNIITNNSSKSFKKLENVQESIRILGANFENKILNEEEQGIQIFLKENIIELKNIGESFDYDKANFRRRLTKNLTEITSKNKILQKFEEKIWKKNSQKNILDMNKNHRLSQDNKIEQGKFNPKYQIQRSNKHNLSKTSIHKRAIFNMKKPVIKFNENDFESREIVVRKEVSTQKEKEKENKRRLRIVHPIIDSKENEEDDELLQNSPFFVIFPKSVLGKVFDLLLIIITLYVIIMNPIRVAFDHSFSFKYIYTDVFVDLFYILDFLSGFFRGFYNSDEDLVINKKLIIEHYLKRFFFIDLINAFPSNAFFYIYLFTSKGQPLKIMYLLKMIRLFKLKKVASKINLNEFNFLEKLDLSPGIIRFLKFILYFFIFTHILSCFWIFIATLDTRNWINSNNEIGECNPYCLYIAAVYFNWTTIFTIGYGDITSHSIYERLYNIFIMMIGVFLYSFAVSSLGTIVARRDKMSIQYNENKDIVEEIREKYPRIGNIQEINKKVIIDGKKKLLRITERVCLYDKLINYLNYNYKVNKIDKNSLLKELPVKIKNLLISHIYKDIFNRFTFFRCTGNNEGFNLRVLLCFIPLKLNKNECAIRQGEIMEEVIFIKKGSLSIEMFHENTKKVAFRLRKNDYFGVISVLNKEKCDFNIRVLSKIAELFLIKKEDLIKLSLDFPDIVKEIYKISYLNYVRLKEIIEEKRDLIQMEKARLKFKKIQKKNLGLEISKSNFKMIPELRNSTKTFDIESYNENCRSNSLKKMKTINLDEKSTSPYKSGTYSQKLNSLTQRSKQSFESKESNLNLVRGKIISTKNEMKLINDNERFMESKDKLGLLSQLNSQDISYNLELDESKKNFIDAENSTKINDDVKTLNTYNLNVVIQNNNFTNISNISSSNHPTSPKDISFRNNIPAYYHRGNSSVKIPQLNSHEILNLVKFDEIDLQNKINRNSKDSKTWIINKKNDDNNFLEQAKMKIITRRNNFNIKNVMKNIKKDVKKKLTENKAFEKDPQQFLQNNFKLILDKHILNEKQGIIKCISKLDNLYEKLSKLK